VISDTQIKKSLFWKILKRDEQMPGAGRNLDIRQRKIV